MKKLVVFTALCLAGLAWAGPARKVLVLEVNGPSGQLVSQKSTASVATGSILQERDTVEVKAGSSLTVLVLGKRERLKVIGPGKFTIGSEGLQEAGVKLERLEAPDSQLSLSGDSHRRLAGLRTRTQVRTLPTGGFDSMTVTPGSLKLSSSTLPEKPLRFTLYSAYRGPLIDAKGIDRDEPEQMVSTALVTPARVDGKVVYSLELPEATGDLTLRVLNGAGVEELLFARVYPLTPSEQAELAAAKISVEAWASRAPGSAEPWIIYGCLLEEKGQLQEALVAVKRALELRPNDAGLMEMKIRLLLDSGDYRAAQETWQVWQKV